MACPLGPSSPGRWSSWGSWARGRGRRRRYWRPDIIYNTFVLLGAPEPRNCQRGSAKQLGHTDRGILVEDVAELSPPLDILVIQ